MGMRSFWRRMRASRGCLSNKSTNGSLHPSVAMLWQIGRNAMIPKSDGSERPVAIMDGWYRANGRAMVSQVALMPYQLGVEVKSGCEIAARLAEVACL